ncbi:MAG: transcriptional regulator [Polyangiales bacterium]
MSFRPMVYRSYEEFEREELRPARSRVGFSLDDLIEETCFDSEVEAEESDDDE